MPKKFLICQLASFGDCLYATTIAKQIKHDYPDSHITWAISTRYKSVLDNNPDVDAVWEIPISYGDLFTEAWHRLMHEALERKKWGEFDEIIFSQIAPRWTQFNGTIRGTILSSYGKPITVSPRPVLVLSKEEVENVARFCENHKIKTYKNAILFECAPTSGQSKNITINFALELSQEILKHEPDTCIILSSPKKLETGDKRILDASELSFRENAELANHCTLFIGCSSGITWVLTSDWVKGIPMLELLDKDFPIFYGVRYDHELQGLPNDAILEMTSFDQNKIVDAVVLALQDKWEKAMNLYNEDYRISYKSFRQMTVVLLKYKHPVAPLFLISRYWKIHHLSLGLLLINVLYAYIEFGILACKKILQIGKNSSGR